MTEKQNFTKTTTDSYDIVIIGAGMAGMAAALSFATHNLSVCLIEQDPISEKTKLLEEHESRVSALYESSCRFLDNLNVWEHVNLSRTCIYDRMEIRDAKSTGKIHFDANQTGYPHIGRIAENKLILCGLYNKILSSNIDLLNPCSYKTIENHPDKVTITLSDNSQITSKLVVAADGAYSTVRKHLSIPTYYRDCLHHALVCNIVTSKSHEHCARQIFLDTGPLAFLPLSNKLNNEKTHLHKSSIVWSLKPDDLNKIIQLNDHDFCDLLNTKSEFWLGNVIKTTPRSTYKLRQLHAMDYYKGRTVLIADASHVVHPLAGQGINLGFTDIAVLADEVSSSFTEYGDPGLPIVLQNYSKRRKKYNVKMLATMESFQHLFNRSETLPIWLRATGMNMLNRLPSIKRHIAKIAMGLKKDIPPLMRAQ